MGPTPAVPSHASTKSSRWVQYLKRFAITFVAMTVVSVIAESISKTDVAAVNTEIVDVIHNFDFPAVLRDAWDSFYDKGDPVPVDVQPKEDPELWKSVPPDLSTYLNKPIRIYDYPHRHFSWVRLLLSPFFGYIQVSSMLSKAWHENILSFATVLLALTVGFCVAGYGIASLNDGKLTKLGLLLAVWLAPFVGGLFMWGLQLVILVPFILLRKLLADVQAIVAFSATVPLLHGIIQAAIRGSGSAPGVLEVTKAQQEHALAEKIEKYVGKSPRQGA
jgi:hypothetical protein